MRIGVFTVLFRDLPFEQALDQAVASGVSAVEIGTGGYPGNWHCPLETRLASSERRQEYLNALARRGLLLSALSCQSEPLHPDQSVAEGADRLFRQTVQLACLLGVPAVNVVSGIPAGAPGDSSPNWITCPWPPHFLKMLEYQWNHVAIPYWREATRFAADHGVKVACEMHPGMLVYNVETLLRMREVAGPAFGCNLDPSHLFWNGVDVVAAIRQLGGCIFHVHGKDCYVDRLNVAVNGCNDHKPYDQVNRRAWTFRSLGYGHDVKVWKDIISALRLAGYDYVISIEQEDALMSASEGLAKSIAVLREVLISERPGPMFWTANRHDPV
jgi:sugar phosphate isomerase/epimerase